MTRDDITRMAREAGFVGFDGDNGPLRRFAALVAEAERERLLSTEIHSCHANCQRFACVQTRKAVEAEREACAKLCEEPEWNAANWCAKQIRARGENT
jgi:hypothetical protein